MNLQTLITALHDGKGIQHKSDITPVVQTLTLGAHSQVPMKGWGLHIAPEGPHFGRETTT